MTLRTGIASAWRMLAREPMAATTVLLDARVADGRL
jgi:hypothetical protein